MLVIFDFDGTIGDTLPTLVDIINKLAPVYHFPKITNINRDSLRGKTSSELLTWFGIGKLRLWLLCRRVRKEHMARIYEAKPFKGLPVALRALQKKHSLALLTSNSCQNVRTFLKKHSLTLFNPLIANANIFGKYRQLLYVCRKAGVTPDQAVYVGDETTDLESAKKAGLHSIAVTWGLNSEKALQQAEPEFLARTPADILAAVRALEKWTIKISESSNTIQNCNK